MTSNSRIPAILLSLFMLLSVSVSAAGAVYVPALAGPGSEPVVATTLPSAPSSLGAQGRALTFEPSEVLSFDIAWFNDSEVLASPLHQSPNATDPIYELVWGANATAVDQPWVVGNVSAGIFVEQPTGTTGASDFHQLVEVTVPPTYVPGSISDLWTLWDQIANNGTWTTYGAQTPTPHVLFSPLMPPGSWVIGLSLTINETLVFYENESVPMWTMRDAFDDPGMLEGNGNVTAPEALVILNGTNRVVVAANATSTDYSGLFTVRFLDVNATLLPDLPTFRSVSQIEAAMAADPSNWSESQRLTYSVAIIGDGITPEPTYTPAASILYPRIDGWADGMALEYYDFGMTSPTPSIFYRFWFDNLSGPSPVDGQWEVLGSLRDGVFVDYVGDPNASTFFRIANVMIPQDTSYSVNAVRSVRDLQLVGLDAYVSLTDQVFNLVPVAEGSTLEEPQDAASAVAWFMGNAVTFFDFSDNGSTEVAYNATTDLVGTTTAVTFGDADGQADVFSALADDVDYAPLVNVSTLSGDPVDFVPGSVRAIAQVDQLLLDEDNWTLEGPVWLANRPVVSNVSAPTMLAHAPAVAYEPFWAWVDGSRIEGYDFGPNPTTTSPVYMLVNSTGVAIEGQWPIIDAVQDGVYLNHSADAGASDLWRAVEVTVPDGYVPNTYKDAAALMGANLSMVVTDDLLDAPVVPKGSWLEEDVGSHPSMRAWYRGTDAYLVPFENTTQLPGFNGTSGQLQQAEIFGINVSGQLPIVATIPGAASYSPLHRMTLYEPSTGYIPDTLRSVDALQGANLSGDVASQLHTMPLVGIPQGVMRYADASAVSYDLTWGWHEGSLISYYGFRGANGTPTPIYVPVNDSGAPFVGQAPILSVIPQGVLAGHDGDAAYTDFVQVYHVWVGDDYVVNELKDASEIVGGDDPVTPTAEVRNAPVVAAGSRLNDDPANRSLQWGWYAGQPVSYLTFETTEDTPSLFNATAGTVSAAPIWTFSTPVQKSIVGTIPGDINYTPLWEVLRITLLDNATGGLLRSVADVEAAGLNASMVGLWLNCPIVGEPVAVPTFVQASAHAYPLQEAWVDDSRVSFYDFGETSPTPSSAYVLVDEQGIPVAGQGDILGAIPEGVFVNASDPNASALWRLTFVTVPDGYVPNTYTSVGELFRAHLPMVLTDTVLNAPAVPAGSTLLDDPLNRTLQPAWYGMQRAWLASFGSITAFDATNGTVAATPLYQWTGLTGQLPVMSTKSGDADYSPLRQLVAAIAPLGYIVGSTRADGNVTVAGHQLNATSRVLDQPQVGSATPDPYVVAPPPTDGTAPTISFSTAPGVSFEEGKVVIAGSVTDASGLSRVEYSIDGTNWTALTLAPTTGVFSLELKSLKAGEYTITVRATDRAPVPNSASKGLPFTVTAPAKDTTPEGMDWNSPAGLAVIITVLALVAAAVVLMIRKPPAPSEDDEDEGVGSDDGEEE